MGGSWYCEVVSGSKAACGVGLYVGGRGAVGECEVVRRYSGLLYATTQRGSYVGL